MAMEAMVISCAAANRIGMNLDVTRGDATVSSFDGSSSGRDSLASGVPTSPLAFRIRPRDVRRVFRITPRDGRRLSWCQHGPARALRIQGTASLGRRAGLSQAVAQSSSDRAVAITWRPVRRSPSVTTPMATSFRSQNGDALIVADVMTKGQIISVTATTTIDEALQALIDNRISGVPVVDDAGYVIGVVSDYDLLTFDSVPFQESQPDPSPNFIFPVAGNTWKKLLTKTEGKTVGDVMTPHPVVVQSTTSLEDAVRLLLEGKYKKLPVVDDNNKLVGILSRGNIVRMALQMRAAEAQSSSD